MGDFNNWMESEQLGIYNLNNLPKINTPFKLASQPDLIFHILKNNNKKKEQEHIYLHVGSL